MSLPLSERLKVPFIQGGMGIAISLGNLAGSVMKEGGMGVISAAQPGFRDPDFQKDPLKANLKALNDEAVRAREISEGNGLLGVNIMHAASHYAQYCRQAEACGYDAILSGAGLALDLPGLVSEKIMIAPIVSSARALLLIMKVWKKRYGRKPDFVVVEGSQAGGHLGFSEKELKEDTCQSLEQIVSEVVQVAEGIPVFAAGGIFDHEDYLRARQAGADGVQSATRLLATRECDASEEFKRLLVETGPDDLVLVHSPAGLMARAIRTPFTEKLISGSGCTEKPADFFCSGCLKRCDQKNASYCISHVLMKAADGSREEGLFFTGTNAVRIQKIETVREVIEDIIYGKQQ